MRHFLQQGRWAISSKTVWRAMLEKGKRQMSGGHYSTPAPFNEPNLHFRPSSPERIQLAATLDNFKRRLPLRVPFVDGQSSDGLTRDLSRTYMPSAHASVFAEYELATAADTEKAIESALKARNVWQNMTFHDRASIFLRAAELISSKYRLELIASTMLGQGKNTWQAEIDAAAELADFFRFNVAYAEQIYHQQSKVISQSHHGRTDWRPLEGFVYSVSPFNFTAIGGNLVSAPALMGNVVVWKPSPMNVYPSWLIHHILLEAGLPDGVIKLVNGDAETVTDVVFNHREFSALAFIGCSDVFRSLWARAAEGVAAKKYRDFPRIVGETSGKNFHLIHPSADISNAAKHTVRAAFEYSGQKCSACSRIYAPRSRADEFFSEVRNQLRRITLGPPEDLSVYSGPMIDKKAFERVKKAIDAANKDPDLETVVGGTYDGSIGYYVDPTIYIAKTPNHELLNRELFGPVLTAYIYEDDAFDTVLGHIDSNGDNFALTGNIFSNDQEAIHQAERRLRFAAGNFYINCKITAAVIGQQSFGGSRSSGTCDKAGSIGFLTRFTAPRTLKEEYNKLDEILYPSNM